MVWRVILCFITVGPTHAPLSWTCIVLQRAAPAPASSDTQTHKPSRRVVVVSRASHLLIRTADVFVVCFYLRKANRYKHWIAATLFPTSCWILLSLIYTQCYLRHFCVHYPLMISKIKLHDVWGSGIWFCLEVKYPLTTPKKEHNPHQQSGHNHRSYIRENCKNSQQIWLQETQ